MQSLKAQMEEMKNMMRLSFDLQVDIQRAIRQEVAAALSAAAGQFACCHIVPLGINLEDWTLVDVKYLEFTSMATDSCCRWSTFLLLCPWFIICVTAVKYY